MTEREISKYFAAMIRDGKSTDRTIYSGNKTMFIDGKSIYSYGKHYCIASFDGNAPWFNETKYSTTTSKHCYMVRNALAIAGVIGSIE